MQTETIRIQPGIRRLWSADQSTLVEYFQRLDLPTRRLRFFAPVNDGFVRSYAEDLLSMDTLVFGAFPDQQLHGVAELRGLLNCWPRRVEVALLVEPAWQDAGIGDALLNRIIAAARNRRITAIHMRCLLENKRMQNLAKKYDAVLDFDVGEVEAKLDPSWPTPMSVFEEMFGDTHSYLQSVFRVLLH